jgi:hypothetical protein
MSASPKKRSYTAPAVRFLGTVDDIDEAAGLSSEQRRAIDRLKLRLQRMENNPNER